MVAMFSRNDPTGQVAITVCGTASRATSRCAAGCAATVVPLSMTMLPTTRVDVFHDAALHDPPAVAAANAAVLDKGRDEWLPGDAPWRFLRHVPRVLPGGRIHPSSNWSGRTPARSKGEFVRRHRPGRRIAAGLHPARRPSAQSSRPAHRIPPRRRSRVDAPASRGRLRRRDRRPVGPHGLEDLSPLLARPVRDSLIAELLADSRRPIPPRRITGRSEWCSPICWPGGNALSPAPVRSTVRRGARCTLGARSGGTRRDVAGTAARRRNRSAAKDFRRSLQGSYGRVGPPVPTPDAHRARR